MMAPQRGNRLYRAWQENTMREESWGNVFGGQVMVMKIPMTNSFLAACAMVVFTIGPAPSASAQQAPAPRQLPRDGFPIGPSAKILSFTASATSIQAGRSVTLTGM